MRLSSLNKLSKQELSALPLSIVIQAIKKSNTLYHDKAKPILTDKVYDVLKDALKQRKPKHALLKQVGATVTAKREKKVKLPYPLFSLDKFKPEDADSFEDWCSEFPGPYIVSDKEDGSSLEILYDKQGRLSDIYTRGNGVLGQRVTRIADFLNIPKKVKTANLVVRGELVMMGRKFDKFAAKDFANPRNLVAGLANKIKGDRSLLKHADLKAYEVISPRTTPSKALKLLAREGFDIVPYKKFSTITLQMLERMFKQRKAASKYEIDGLVIEQDRVNKRPAAGTHSPAYAFAFKADYEGSIVQTKVLDVEWDSSKHGILKPVVLIQPVKLAGVTIRRASGYNAFFIVNGYGQGAKKKNLESKPIGKGALVSITRSGDVIPKILSVIKGASKPGLPKENNWKWNSSGVDIVLKNIGSDDNVRAKRITSFFTTLGVDGIKQGTVEQLIEAGLDTILKITKASVEDFLQIDGFKERKANTLWQNIQDKTKEVTLPVLMDGSGHFGSGFGTRRLKVVVEAYPDVLKWGAKSPAWITIQIQKLPGFQANTAGKFAVGLPKFLKWLKASKIKPVIAKKIRLKSKSLVGVSVCFTGFRDSSLEEQIVENGGTIATGVNKNTKVLLAPSVNGSSSKLVKAKQLGIPVYTADGFKKKYKL